MSVEAARAHLARYGLEDRIQEFDTSSATVALAAEALGVEPARIAKTLSFRYKDTALLLVTAGDSRVDNHAFREAFGVRAKMLSAEEVLEKTGHPVGGVCPFGRKEGVAVYLDNSLRRFSSVYPAVGSANSGIELTPEELYRSAEASAWVQVCHTPDAPACSAE